MDPVHDESAYDARAKFIWTDQFVHVWAVLLDEDPQPSKAEATLECDDYLVLIDPAPKLFVEHLLASYGPGCSRLN